MFFVTKEQYFNLKKFLDFYGSRPAATTSKSSIHGIHGMQRKNQHSNYGRHTATRYDTYVLDTAVLDTRKDFFFFPEYCNVKIVSASAVSNVRTWT